jgi:hypothetical protein
MRTPILHAVFSESASGCLKQVLGTDRRERIITLTDDLSIGPIDRNDGGARTRWLREQFGRDAYEQIADIDGFWSDVSSPENHIVAYVSRRNARECAGLFELVRQRGGALLEIVDVTNVGFTNPDGTPDLEKSLGIAELTPAEVIERKLLESKASLSASAMLSCTQNWMLLRQENAFLRVIENGILVSALITHFDAKIACCVTPEWQSFTRMLGPFYSSTRVEGINAPDLRFISSRIAALVASRQLELDGDLSTLNTSRSSFVRLCR